MSQRRWKVAPLASIATLLGAAGGGFVGFAAGFILLFVLFADGTPLYLFVRRYVEEPEKLVLLLTTVSLALAGGVLGFSVSRRYLGRRD